jgi:4-hydroxythreonine-4-phosphate dehydrogenase
MLVVTPGMGIGPEVTIRALAARPRNALLIGERVVYELARDAGLAIVETNEPGPGLRFYEPRTSEPIPVAAIRMGVELCMQGKAVALVTGPIHKAKLAAQGFTFAGHTGFLGHLAGVTRPVMAFHAPGLVLSLVTTHVPLVEVRLDAADIASVVRTTAAAVRSLGIARPRIAVTGLNPHAGDGGLLGSEDEAIIRPAVVSLRELDVVGPISAEAAFTQRDRYDVIVAMYHDQGLVPLKALWFGETVNWTLGLPFVRTSVDHGTADDLVGTGRADAQSMEAALALAERLTGAG